MQAGPGLPLLDVLEHSLDVLTPPGLAPLGPPGVVCLGHVGQLQIDGLGLDACHPVPCLRLTHSPSPLRVRHAFAFLGACGPSYRWRTNF
jgi:hypothetical protein